MQIHPLANVETRDVDLTPEYGSTADTGKSYYRKSL